MKIFISILMAALLFSCNQKENEDKTAMLEGKIKSLEERINNSYSPGFGDLMGSIQTHHAKLWFAGTNENWRLAEFEIHEIQESLEGIQKFNSHRPETKSISMIFPAMDSVSNAIKQKNLLLFKSSYNLLTNSCNTCHHASQHEFNMITIPSQSPFSNQSFKPLQ